MEETHLKFFLINCCKILACSKKIMHLVPVPSAFLGLKQYYESLPLVLALIIF